KSPATMSAATRCAAICLLITSCSFPIANSQSACRCMSTAARHNPIISWDCHTGRQEMIRCSMTEQKTWVQAQSYCRQQYTDLATVDNMAEMQQLKGFIPPGFNVVWIGLFFDNWVWSDGNKTTFRYWHPGQPYNALGEGNCAVVSTSWGGDWDDTACNGSKIHKLFSNR
uniref:C-type lectin domain-containing protein n=1 Tax=Astyanax mexicanus TaxID=7994 RepID=A0A8B9RGY6_ASTMX